MSTISLKSFKQHLESGRLEQLLDYCIAEDDPWLFRSTPSAYCRVKALVQEALPAYAINCLVVGSAKFGFSVAPDRFAQPFAATSDVDIVVVCEPLFDEIWSVMLRWRYPWHVRKWSAHDQRWGYSYLEDQFAGWISPDRIRVPSLGGKRVPPPLRPFASTWFDTFKRVGMFGPVRGHEASGRLFRTVEHFRAYQRWGLKKVERQLRGVGP